MGGGDGYAVDFKEDRRFQGVQLTQAQFSGDEPDTVWFDQMGAPDGGGHVVLEFEDIAYRVDLAPFTGRVTVEAVD